MNLPEEKRRQQLIESLEAYRGREALYREGNRFCRVRVDDFETTDEGLSALVSVVHTVGLDDQWPESWNVFTPWKRLKEADDLWVSPYVGLKMNFEPGLVASIVRWSESFPCEQYDKDRFEQVVLQIQKYRKTKLARQLSGVLVLFYDEQLIGNVSEHFLNGDVEVHGKFAAAELNDDLRLALGEYRRWWEDSWRRNDPGPAPDENLDGNWLVELQSGKRFRCSTPIIDFDQRTIILCRLVES